LDNEVEIEKVTRINSDFQRKVSALLKFNWKKPWTHLKYKSYKREVDFVQVFTDLLCYERIGWKDIDFYEEREKIWKELEQAFFYGDLKWLESVSKELDASWTLYGHLIDLEPSWKAFNELSRWIIWHIEDNFNPEYILTKLQ